MLASFVIGFHTRRLDNLLQTIRFLELWHSQVIAESELILVCQDHCGLIESQFAKTYCFNLEVPNMQLPHLSNFGISQTSSENIVLLESDRILPKGYFEDVLSNIVEGQQVTTKKMHHLTKVASDQIIIDQTYDYNDEHRSETNEILQRNMWSGNTTFKKQDFIKVGKMDEGYVGYGWADHDMTATMEAGGIQSVFRTELELHLYHEPMTYGTSDQKWLFIQNGVQYCKKWKIPFPDLLKEEISKYSRVAI